jgi:hypothetical protein
MNHAVHYTDTKAFHVTSSGNRFTGCYIDGGRAVFTEAALRRNTWMNGFECCQGTSAAAGTTGSGILLVGKDVGPGLTITHNEFGGGGIFHRRTLWPAAGATKERPSANEQSSAGTCAGAANLNVSANDSDCQGLTLRDGAPSHSAAACEAACCADAACSVYQFCAAGGQCTGATGTAAQCWTGSFDHCSAGGRHGWEGKGGIANPAPPVSVRGVLIAENANSAAGLKGSRATLSLTQHAATSWPFDFCSLLVFAQVAIVRVHVTAESGFPTAVARPPNGCKLTVETDVPVTGTVTVDVDSALPSNQFV